MTRALALLSVLVLTPLPAGAADLASAPVFIALSVPDLEASVKWYTEMLDLTATRLPAAPQAPQVKVALLQGQGLLVELIQHPDAVAPEPARGGAENRHLTRGLFKAGFFVRDLDATVARLRRRGARFEGQAFSDAVTRTRSILLRDNNDTLLQLFERLPSR